METAHSALSKIESLASESETQLRYALESLSEDQAESILYDWRWNGRPSQLIPGMPGASSQRTDWVFWLCLAGRGWGKTRVGAETVREWAEDPKARILMIAPTASDVREVMLEGPSGLLQCYPGNRRPVYLPTRHLVMFPSGAVGITRSADEPERLRGPQFTKFWADEICAWAKPQDAWDQIMFGFRVITPELRGIITTTPKPIKTLKEILKDPDTVVTRGSSYENRSNISDKYYSKVIAPYEGTRLGRQEINAEVLEDVPGALWTRQLIDATRIHPRDIPWHLIIRIVVAIDPAVTHREDSDETGIVVLAMTQSLHVLVLDDLSCRESPLGWAKIAVASYRSRGAARIIGEVNNGGDLVEANIRGVDPNVAFRAVRASRGKYIRAEPVSALYEQGRVHHVGPLPALEDQMCLAGGSMILTARGSVPVEHVRLFDLVWTRAGWKRVTRTACNGYRKTLQIVSDDGHRRRQLICTPDHKILANGIFVNSFEVQKNDKMLICRNPSGTPLSSSTESGIFGTSATDISRQAGLAGGACFIGTSGNPSMGLYPKVGRFTTKTKIAAITPSKTFKRFPFLPMSKRTEAPAERGPTHLKSGASNQNRSGLSACRDPSSAGIAESSSYQQECAPHFASCIIEAVHELPGTSLVYDLSVDGCHELFANELLVHNCSWTPLGNEPSPDRLDALVWGVTDLLIDQEEMEQHMQFMRPYSISNI